MYTIFSDLLRRQRAMSIFIVFATLSALWAMLFSILGILQSPL
jgi:hypothetical protein